MAATLGNLKVTTEVLSRLPPETLLRLKSVHKSWYALINDPEFVSNHFSNSLQHEHIFLKRVVTNDSGKEEITFSILNFSFDPYLSVSVQNVDLPNYENSQYFKIHGHSHGLICVSDPDMNVFLCNPATREFRKLPPSIFSISGPPCESHCYDGYVLIMSAVGFGYDANSRDFKVVRIVDFVERYGYFLHQKAEIYDFSKDRWREIEPPVRGDVVGLIPSFEMFHVGTYYWWSCERDRLFIQSFDMNDEVFREISLPESFKMENKLEKHWNMGVLNGSIVVFLYLLEANEKIFDIWKMEKDESVVSWSKLLTIGPLSEIDKPLLFVSSDELLMEANKGHLILYHIKTQQIKELPIKGNQDMFEATHFVKSLFPVK